MMPGLTLDDDESRWIGFAPDDDGRCIGNDPMCPCQDGDACHYRDAADGTKGWPIPDRPEQQEDEPSGHAQALHAG
jgi:hypothetical protein